MPYRLCNFYQSMKMKSQHKAFFQRVITFCDILKISSRAEFHPISMKIGNDLQKSVNPITGLLLLSSYYIMLPGGSSPSLVSLATTVDALSTPFLSSVTMKSGFKCLSKWLNVASENKIFAEKSFKSYQILSGRNWKLFKRKGIPFYEKSLSFSLEYFISWRFKVCKAVWKQLNGVEKPKKVDFLDRFECNVSFKSAMKKCKFSFCWLKYLIRLKCCEMNMWKWRIKVIWVKKQDWEKQNLVWIRFCFSDVKTTKTNSHLLDHHPQ